ncbi:hypothetical protein Ndes2526A_g08693 [Nannochloris sp. 'desiccata']
MVTRNQSASQGGGREPSQQHETNEDAKMVDEFVIKLAQALQRRGKRTWKAQEASKAVEQAIAALPHSTLKDSLKASLSEASTKLLKQLQSLGEQEQRIKPAKRSKPAAPPITQQKKKKKLSRQSGVAAAPSAPTLMDCSLEAAVAAILRGKTPKSYETVAIAPLISRFPPPEGLIEWHLLRSNPAEEEDWAAQIDSAEKALHICNALATQAPSSEYALAVFEPALAQMLKAVEALEAATITSLVEEEEQGGADDSREIASGWEQLKSLSNRAVMCMNLAAKEVSVVNQAANDDVGAEADRNTRWWLSWNSNLFISDDTAGETGGNGSSRDVSDGRPRGSHHSGDVRNIARTACSVAVSLCTVARLRTFEGDDDLQVDALAAHAAHDMKILAPYAAIGQVTGAAEAVLEEINKTTDDAMLFLALYMAAIDSSDTNNAEYYFLRMIAARNASAAATSLGNTAVAGRVLSSAAVAPPPPTALEWLREQPPSSVILQALESLQRGPQGLSAHLIYEAPERAVRALAAAAKAGGVLAVGASGADGDNGQDSTPADDLLFFVSKKGDGGAFNRQDWGSDREEGSDDEDGRAGLVIDDLPDEGKSMSGEEDYNEDSDDE